LQYRDVELIPLSEELRLVNNYFALQAPRYGNNLVFNQRVPHENLISNIPPMALQILAENAIKHNIISSVKPLYFSITVYQSYIVVSNNIQKKKQSEPSSGLGLQNIKSRYALVTGIPVEIEETTNNFTVKLPLLT
jgi:LytS/YehU family sensor histidine kinase